MIGSFITFLIFLTILAAATRDSFVFTLLYLAAGAFIAGRAWSNRAARNISVQRIYDKRAFPGETIPVRLRATNHGRLPVVWMGLQDYLPLEISHLSSFQRAFSLGGKKHLDYEYQLTPKKRGYYPLGPLKITTGDLFGLTNGLELQGHIEYLTVFPTVLPFSSFSLPSHAPLGTLRSNQPIFEDPSRPAGKRDYSRGDSLRRIDWKASASLGRLQVKLFEPSIALETMLFVNANTQDYPLLGRYDALEIAITTAASIANWAISHKQSAGLMTNGQDVAYPEQALQALPPRKGRGHLMRILEMLARLKGQAAPLQSAEFLATHLPRLSWGTTLVVLTPLANEPLFDQIFHARRMGIDVVLILCGEVPNIQQTRLRAQQFNIPFHAFSKERDLEIWRGASSKGITSFHKNGG